MGAKLWPSSHWTKASFWLRRSSWWLGPILWSWIWWRWLVIFPTGNPLLGESIGTISHSFGFPFIISEKPMTLRLSQTSGVLGTVHKIFLGQCLAAFWFVFPGWLGQWLKPKGKPRLIRPLRIAVSCRCGCWSEVAHAMLSIWRTNSICHKMGAHSLFLCLEVWCLENSWLHHRHSWRPWLDVFSGPGVTNMAAKITIIRRSPDSCVSNCWYFLFFVVVKTFYSSIWIIRFAEKGYWCKTSSCASLNLIIVCVQMDCHFRSRRTLQSSIIFDRWQMFG
jgi:hypothetical protein